MQIRSHLQQLWRPLWNSWWLPTCECTCPVPGSMDLRLDVHSDAPRNLPASHSHSVGSVFQLIEAPKLTTDDAAVIDVSSHLTNGG